MQAISQTASSFCAVVKQDPRWKDTPKIPKETLREFYTKEYKPTFRKDHPGTNIINFSPLFVVGIQGSRRSQTGGGGRECAKFQK